MMSNPYEPETQKPNKEDRVLAVLRAARRRPERARQLLDGLLVQLRVAGCFDPTRSIYDRDRARTAQRAFRPLGWVLSDDGYLNPAGAIDLTTGGREALDEQVDRLRRAADHPGQLLGSAKDLLEAVAKFVLEEFGVTVAKNDSFDHAWHRARRPAEPPACAGESCTTGGEQHQGDPAKLVDYRRAGQQAAKSSGHGEDPPDTADRRQRGHGATGRARGVQRRGVRASHAGPRHGTGGLTAVPLHRAEWSVQDPARRAAERDEAAVAAWAGDVDRQERRSLTLGHGWASRTSPGRT